MYTARKLSKLLTEKVDFRQADTFQNVRVVYVYQGHLVKVKVKVKVTAINSRKRWYSAFD